MNHQTFAPGAILAAQEHALREYPLESCGFIVDDEYMPVRNAANPVETHDEKNPNCACQACVFVISPEDHMRALAHARVQAVVHSHPGGPYFPSHRDMASQITSDVPWMIIPVREDAAGEPICWGDSLPIAPLIGRTFMHGVADCYSIIRDTYRLGKDGMAAQDIKQWPADPILLPEVPRSDNWWSGDDDFYMSNFKPFGFRQIAPSEALPGDVFLCRVRSPKLNHGGVIVDNGLLLHHLPNRLSRREPLGIWSRAIEMFIRHEAMYKC